MKRWELGCTRLQNYSFQSENNHWLIGNTPVARSRGSQAGAWEPGKGLRERDAFGLNANIVGQKLAHFRVAQGSGMASQLFAILE